MSGSLDFNNNSPHDSDTNIDERLITSEPPIFQPVLAEYVAERSAYTVEQIIEYAELGVIPPWLCEHRTGGWVFSDKLNTKTIRKIVETGMVWVPNVPEDVAKITLAWTSEHYEKPKTHQAIILDWFRCSSDPLEATTSLFVWWCMWHPDNTHQPPDASLTALRWRTVSDWYEMLVDSGIPHSSPHHQTQVTVIMQTEEEPF